MARQFVLNFPAAKVFISLVPYVHSHTTIVVISSRPTSPAEFDFETSVTTEDTRRDYGETRFRSLGFIGAELHAHVFIVRGDAMRIVSLRKANRRERARHEKNSES
ncbi:MAG: BrnT family toxin [Acidobacteriaceae bacterium]